jgi:hypothetical protein
MYKNDDRILVIGESGSDNATPSRIKIGATNRRNSGRLQCKNNAKFSDCFTGSRKSFIIKGRGSSVVEQPIRNLTLTQRKKTQSNYSQQNQQYKKTVLVAPLS